MRIGNKIAFFYLLTLALGAICTALLLQPNGAQQAKAESLQDVTPSPTQSTDPHDFTPQAPYQSAPATNPDSVP